MNSKNKEFHLNWLSLGHNDKVGVGNFFEYIIQIIYQSILSKSDIAVDGGANRGMHTLPMSRSVGHLGRVIGFEPLPKLALDLSKKIHESEIVNISIIPKALGSHLGEVNFHYYPNCDFRSAIHQQEDGVEFNKLDQKKISVPLTTLDYEIEINNQVRFIKLDLEGGEYHALLGASRIMTKDRPLIVFENTRQISANAYQYDKSEWFSMFHERGYSVFDLFGRPFTIQDWDLPNMPWYFIASSRPTDTEFIEHKLPHLIGTISSVLNRHCLTK